MIIKQLKKGKKNTYEITFQDGNKEIFYDDLIVKYNLLPKKEINEKEWNQIKKENENLESYYVAIHYLTTKLRTKKEIKNQLEKQNFSKETITNTIARLEKEEYLNEEIYIRSFINDGIRFSNDGPLKLKKKLQDNGLKESKIEEIFLEFPKEVWLPKLEKTFQKKANSHHTDGLEKWQWKCIQYLVLLGYPKEWVVEILPHIEWKKDERIIEKEYEKLKRKLSRKYMGNELEFQIKRKLYEKGFSKEEIEEIIKKGRE